MTANFTSLVPPGTEACGCCDGIIASTPGSISNRIGLAAVSYRIGAYAEFRESMLAGLSSSAYPKLSELRTREADDYTLGLIDAVACAADVLTFYQERIANESYLRTATERVSLQEMAKLIGYRLRPGVAAETRLAFALEPQKTPPPGMSPDPGAFVTGIPESVTLPVGLQVQSVPGPDEKPQTFETVEAIEARAEWNAMCAVISEDRVPGFGSLEVWVQGLDTQLKAGDMLLLVGAEFESDTSSDRWDVRVLSEVETDTANARTRLEWLKPLGSLSPESSPALAPRIYALRQRAAVFGHNAPDWAGMNDEFKAGYLGYEKTSQLTAEDRREWPEFEISAPSAEGIELRVFVSAADAADALRESVRASALTQAQQGITAAAKMAAGGAELVQRVAGVPGEIGKALFSVIHELPSVLQDLGTEVMRPIQDIANVVTAELADIKGRVEAAQDGLEDLAGRIFNLENPDD